MRYGFLLLILLMCLPAQAQDQSIDDPIQLALNTGITTTPTSFSSEDRYNQSRSRDMPSPDINQRFDFGDLFSTEIQPPHLPDYWDTYASAPRHRYIPKYKGMHGLIHKQITRFCMKLYRQYSNEYWRQRSLMDRDFYSTYKQFKQNERDFHNRWWDRPYYEFYEIEKGGTERRVYQVGETRDIFSLGPLMLSNSGKVSWEGWRFNFSHQREKELDREYDDLGNPLPRQQLNERALVFGISPPKGNLYTAENWTLSGSVKVNLRLNTLQGNGSTIRGKLTFFAYTGYKPKPWLGIEIEATAKPLRQDYRITATFALVRW